MLCPEALTGSRSSGKLELFVTDNGSDGLTPTLAKISELSPGNFEQSFLATLAAGIGPVEVAVAPSFLRPSRMSRLAMAAISTRALRARG